MSNKVNIGIAYDSNSLVLVQDFERDYIIWEKPITYKDEILLLKGKITLGTIYNIAIYYDPPPEPLTQEQLSKSPYNGAYSLGVEAGYIIPQPYYMEEATYVHASKWYVSSSGEFEVVANIKPLLKYGKGVYTVIIWAKINGEYVDLTSYSIFII